MKNTSRLISTCWLLAYSLGLSATPQKYEITFVPVNGVSGSGSFYWDSTVQQISDLSWDFGWGYDSGGNYVHFAGGVDDELAGWNDEILGGTKAAYMFEILTRYDVHPYDCASSDCNLDFGPDGRGGLYGAVDFMEIDYQRLPDTSYWQGYDASTDTVTLSQGYISTSGSCDPAEATTLSLLGEVSFSIPSIDAPWGDLPAGSPVQTTLTYDGCSVPPGGGDFAIVGDLDGGLTMSFDGFVLTARDDANFAEGDGTYSPRAFFDDAGNLSGIDFNWTPDTVSRLSLRNHDLTFEGWIDDQLVLSGTLFSVPEPGTGALLGLGLAGLGLRRRKAS